MWLQNYSLSNYHTIPQLGVFAVALPNKWKNYRGIMTIIITLAVWFVKQIMPFVLCPSWWDCWLYQCQKSLWHNIATTEVVMWIPSRQYWQVTLHPRGMTCYGPIVTWLGAICKSMARNRKRMHTNCWRWPIQQRNWTSGWMPCASWACGLMAQQLWHSIKIL